MSGTKWISSETTEGQREVLAPGPPRQRLVPGFQDLWTAQGLQQ